MFNLIGCKKNKHHHDFRHYEKTEATCEKEGNIEYWKCTTCNKYFSDANGKKEISDVTIKKLPHQYIGFAYSNLEHTKECKNCHTIVDKEKHIFDENGKCSVCDYQDVLEYSLFDDNTYKVVGPTNKDVTKVAIPKYYNDILVTIIGDGSFAFCESLQSITIPSSITNVGQYSFTGCISLIEVTIPSSVRKIGEGAFIGCTGLESITLPFVGDGNEKTNFSYIFEGLLLTLPLPSLPFIEKGVPQSLKEIIITGGNIIGESAFTGCANVESITIPSSVTSIGKSAFEDCTSLESITIPSSVTSIGESAFEDCTSLESITIPSSVTSIGYAAFYGCSNLNEINIPSIALWCQIDFQSSRANPLSNEQAVLKINKEEITNITEEMLEGVTTIPNYAFVGYHKLQSITLSSSITNIGYCAFFGCASLKSITIPSSVTSIGYGALSECLSLSSIIVDSNNSQYDSRDNCNAIIETSTKTLIVGCKDTIIPSSVTSIGELAFTGCISLQNITIPSSITSIGYGAFYDCTNLQSVTIPSSVINIGAGAFAECTNLKKAIFEDPNNWVVNEKNLSSDELKNPELAAAYLIDEDAFIYYAWTKKTA